MNALARSEAKLFSIIAGRWPERKTPGGPGVWWLVGG